MNKPTVYIYGDSFADPSWGEPNNYNTVWPLALAEHYTVINRALKGTGPEYSIDQLCRDQPPKPNSVCIFVLSDPHRLYLQNFWKHDNQQVHIYDVAQKRFKHPGYMFARQLFEHYLTDCTYANRIAQTIGAVNSLTHTYTRTLIWPIAPVAIDLRLDPSVTLIQRGLLDISTAEYSANNKGDPTRDPRPNHLSEVNHRVMLSQMLAWIEDSVVPDDQAFVSCCA